MTNIINISSVKGVFDKIKLSVIFDLVILTDILPLT